MTIRKVPTLEEVRRWPATVPVEWGCRAIGVSKSYGYELIKADEYPCRILRLRGVHRVVTASLVALLEAEATDAEEVA